LICWPEILALIFIIRIKEHFDTAPFVIKVFLVAFHFDEQCGV